MSWTTRALAPMVLGGAPPNLGPGQPLQMIAILLTYHLEYLTYFNASLVQNYAVVVSYSMYNDTIYSENLFRSSLRTKC